MNINTYNQNDARALLKYHGSDARLPHTGKTLWVCNPIGKQSFKVTKVETDKYVVEYL